MSELLQAVTAAGVAHLGQALAAGSEAAPQALAGAVLGLAEWALESLDELLAADAPPRPLACGPGCAPCCHNQVTLGMPELLLLAEYLDEHLTPAQLARLRARLDHAAPLLAGLDPTRPDARLLAAIRRELPCPLLEGGLCLAYPVRPLVCRGFHSLDRAACHRALEDDDPLAGAPSYPDRIRASLEIGQGLSRALAELRLDGAPRLLGAALDAILAQGMFQALQTWLATPFTPPSGHNLEHTASQMSVPEPEAGLCAMDKPFRLG